MSGETTLLSCPFCGGEAETWDGAGPWHVVCTKCGTVGSPCLTEAEAIAAWNTRAELGSGTCRNISELNKNGVSGYYFTCSECGLSVCANMGVAEIEMSGPRSFSWKTNGRYEFEKCPRCGKAVE